MVESDGALSNYKRNNGYSQKLELGSSTNFHILISHYFLSNQNEDTSQKEEKLNSTIRDSLSVPERAMRGAR